MLESNQQVLSDIKRPFSSFSVGDLEQKCSIIILALGSIYFSAVCTEVRHEENVIHASHPQLADSQSGQISW